MKNTLYFLALVTMFVQGTSFKKSTNEKRTLIDFFLPIEPLSPLTSKGVWGDAAVFPDWRGNQIMTRKPENIWLKIGATGTVVLLKTTMVNTTCTPAAGHKNFSMVQAGQKIRKEFMRLATDYKVLIKTWG